MPYIRIPLKNILNVSKIITLYYFEFAPNYKTRGETHDFWELVYVDSGELDLRGGDESHHLKKGELIFHRPNEFHNVCCDGEHTASVFIITFECRSPAMKFFYGKHMAVPKELRGLLDALVEECTRNFRISSVPLSLNDNAPIGGLQMVQNYLECFLICLMRHEAESVEEQKLFYSSQKSMESDVAESMIAYLRADLRRKITLEELSREFHFSISTLCSIFRKNTGESIIHYLMKLKLAEGKRLLRETTESISRISEELGFDSPQHFSRMFRKYTGRSPRDYRNAVANHISIDSLKK